MSLDNIFGSFQSIRSLYKKITNNEKENKQTNTIDSDHVIIDIDIYDNQLINTDQTDYNSFIQNYYIKNENDDHEIQNSYTEQLFQNPIYIESYDNTKKSKIDVYDHEYFNIV